MAYYVYILSNNYNTTIYTGVTNNLSRYTMKCIVIPLRQ